MPSLPRASAFDRLQASFLLGETRALIARPESWAPSLHLAQDRHGAVVDPLDRSAVRWSAEGALSRAARQVSGTTALLALEALHDVVGASFVALDRGTPLPSHAELLAVIDGARAMLNVEDEPEPEPPAAAEAVG